MTTSSEQIPDELMREARMLLGLLGAGVTAYRLERIARALHARDKRAAEIADVVEERENTLWCRAKGAATAEKHLYTADVVEEIYSAILNRDPTPAVSSPGCGTSEAPASASYSSSAPVMPRAGVCLGDEASRPDASAHHIARHAAPAADDGQPGAPSSAHGGAKREGVVSASPGRGDTSSRHSCTKAEQAVTHSHSSRLSSSATNADDATILPASSAPLSDEAQP